MNEVREYRIPLLMAAGTLVVALLIWAVLISPQNSKLSSLQAQATTLQNQQTTLETKLASLKTEQQKLSSSCADLQKIATQIPSVQSPTDVDAEESSFENQFNGLVGRFGSYPDPVQRVRPGHDGPGHPGPPATGASTTPAGVVAVPTTLAVTGTYDQIHAFIDDLDGFPRLFVIQNLNLSYGPATPASSGADHRRLPRLRHRDGVGHRLGTPAVDRRAAHPGQRRPVHAGHQRVDLLHVDAECPRCLHQGHGGRPLSTAGTGRRTGTTGWARRPGGRPPRPR